MGRKHEQILPFNVEDPDQYDQVATLSEQRRLPAKLMPKETAETHERAEEFARLLDFVETWIAKHLKLSVSPSKPLLCDLYFLTTAQWDEEFLLEIAQVRYVELNFYLTCLGLASLKTRQAFVRRREDDGEKKTFVHEVLHLMSKTLIEFERDPEGLVMGSGLAGIKILNEGVTELITHEIMSAFDPEWRKRPVYRNQHWHTALVGFLITSLAKELGVAPRQLRYEVFYQAYFRGRPDLVIQLISQVFGPASVEFLSRFPQEYEESTANLLLHDFFESL